MPVQSALPVELIMTGQLGADAPLMCVNDKQQTGNMTLNNK